MENVLCAFVSTNCAHSQSRMTDAGDDERKRQPSYSDDIAASKRLRTPVTPVFEGEERGVMSAWLSVEDERETPDLSKLLETEIMLPVKVKIVDDPHSSSPTIFHSSTSYVTINGNEESCGSSFSESECSVMVGISSAFRKLTASVESIGGACLVEEAREWINGCDFLKGHDYDMVEKFLVDDFCDHSIWID